MDTYNEITSADAERNYINVLKGILIILVVVGHFGQTLANTFPVDIAFLERGLILFIYSFHMPLFLFVSGYLSTNTEKRRSKAFKDLFIPFLIFQAFVGLCILILNGSAEVFRNIFVPQMGAWYLMALFIFRLLMPDFERIHFVTVIAILLSVFSFLFSGIGNEFAMTRVLGFFMYFLLGFLTKKVNVINKLHSLINLQISRIVIIILLVVSIIIVYYQDNYLQWLSIFTRNMPQGVSVFEGFIYNSISIALALLIGVLFLNAIPKHNKILEHIGQDTMPLYLSHLILFMAFGFLKGHFNWVISSTIAVVCICFSVVVFSTKTYRKGFNTAIEKVNSLIFIPKNEGNG
jgi:fucose 4-O-acetylase-like acetyltransferase